jgi:beta-mannosidase
MTFLYMLAEVLVVIAALTVGDEISLNGNDWILSDSAGKVKNIKATVPGIVHLDLLANNVIQDPYYGYNDQNYQWIAYSNWSYITSFNLQSLNDENIFLKCDGIDTVATIKINDEIVGTANNYYRRWHYDITKLAKAGSNKLEIIIESAANYSSNKRSKYPYKIYCGGDYIPDTARNFIRKTQSDFGWDWGPAFVPAGIWQNISVITAKSVHITEIVPKVHHNDSLFSYFIEALVCFTVLDQADYTLSITIGVANTPFSSPHTETVDALKGSINECVRIYTYTVKDDQLDNYLWKPYSSFSTKPLLYEANVVVSVSNGTHNLFDTSCVRKIGFRNIQIVEEVPPIKEKGLLFYFQQSDSKGSYPIYIKGSNFIPMDAFVTRAGPDVARRLLVSAIQGNQNMIRVWGGGLYQPDWFYDMCDELGLMVWQEFMFAVSLYPRDTEFLNNIWEEVKDVVRRLGYHPSIVLWSGNNENQDYAIVNTSLLVDYSVLYDGTVRKCLWQEDTTRSFWPSSPSNGAMIDDPSMGLYIQRWGNSQDTTMGDIHRYDYFHVCNNVSTFPRPRFASEFGFQSYPSFNSISKISSKSDWSNDSPFFTNHRQHHPDGNKQMTDMMKFFFHLPNNTDQVEKFKDYIYLSQVVQVICIASEAEHYKRLMSEEGAYTRGTLYWQLNDIWQAQTWASIEYSGRWKLLHYAMKKVYAEVHVSSFTMDNSFIVYVSVDQPQMTIKYTLIIQVYTWEVGRDHMNSSCILSDCHFRAKN